MILHALATHIEGKRIAGRKFSATAEHLATDSPEWDKGFAIWVGSTITGGVTIPEGRYVPPGSVIDTQAKADALGPRVGSPHEKINEAVVYVNKELAQG